jgi:hypothetical protein
MNEPLLKISVAQGSPVSPEFEKAFTQLVDELPTYLARLLAMHGYQVILARLIVDVYPELKGQLLDSIEAGVDAEKRQVKYWDNIKGVHDFGTLKLVYPEYYRHWQSNELIENKKWSFTHLFYHEIGHAIDLLPGWTGFPLLSESFYFIDAYCRDLGRLSSADRSQLDYQLNHSQATRKEIFADTCSAFLWGGDDYTHRHREFFPLTVNYIQQRIFYCLPEIYDDSDSLQLFYAQESRREWHPEKSIFSLLGY